MGTENARRSRRVTRYREIAKVLWDEGLFSLTKGSDLAQYAENELAAEEIPESDAAKQAIKIRRALEQLGPAFVKVGQLLATRRDLISAELSSELDRLKDDVPAESPEAIRAVVEEELGAPLEELYSSFDLEPLAAASIGQVHVATLKDGTEVVVKVQRPGVAELMEVDLDILVTQARRLSKHAEWAKDLDVVAIADEMASILGAEVDYTNERRNLEQFRADFADENDIEFPAPYPELSTARVLTMQKIDGIPGTDEEGLDSAGIDRRRVAEIGVAAYLKQFFELGHFHADPHEGNIFALRDGRVSFVDFGRVATLTERDRNRGIRLMAGIATGDAASATDVLLQVCGAPPETRVVELQREIEIVLDEYQAAASRGESGLTQAANGMLNALRAQRLRMPARFVVLLTTVGVLEGVARNLSPGFDLIAELRKNLSDLMKASSKSNSPAQMLMRWTQQYGALLDEMPVSLSRAMRRAAEGEFRVAVRPTDYDVMFDRIEALVNRIAFAIVASAFVLLWAAVIVSGTGERFALTSGIGGVVTLLAVLALWRWSRGTKKERQARQKEQKRRERI